MVPKYSQSQSMGKNTVELRTMARTGAELPSKSTAVLAWVSKMTPFCPPSVTSTVRRVLLYRALTPRLKPFTWLDSMV